MSRLRKAGILINIFLLAFLTTTLVSAFEFRYKVIDAELKPYYNEYHSLLEQNCPNKRYNQSHRFIIELVDEIPDDENWIGMCRIKVNGFSISILRGFWNKATHNTKRQLMFHELAHCLIKREHDEDNVNHYMYPSLSPIQPDLYINQAIDDIIDYCN